MSTVTLGMVGGEGASLSLRNGWSIERRATVSGLESSGYAKLREAVMHVDMPRLRSAHPTIPSLRLEALEPRAVSADTVEVRLIYRQSGAASGEDTLIEVGSTVTQEYTDVDITGKQVTVKWQDVETGGLIDVLRPRHTVTFRQTETSDPSKKSRQYVGTANDKEWRGKPMGTWLCTQLTGTSNDSGATFAVTYGFAFKPIKADDDHGWLGVLIYLDPATGRPPKGAKPGDGKELYVVYHTMNFNALNLPQGDQQLIIKDLDWALAQ